MNEPTRNGACASHGPNGAAVLPRLEGLLLEQGETSVGAGCVFGVACEAGRLSPTAKQRIEWEAKRAAADGNTRQDACPHPYDSEEGLHWTAVFLLAGGRLK